MNPIWNILFGGIGSILPKVKDLAEVFAGNRKDRDKNEFDEQIAIHQEQENGATIGKAGRNWFDSLMDGVNRLPRPAMTMGVVALIWYPMHDPAGYKVSMDALSSMPPWLSTILTCIVIFWFGSRTIAKDIPSQVAKERERVEARKPVANSAAADWKKTVFKP